MSAKDKFTARVWDKKSPIGQYTANELLRAKPEYVSDDVIITSYDGIDQRVFSVGEVYSEYPTQTKGMNSDQVIDWFIKYRIAKIAEQERIIEFRETGYMNAMVELEEQILALTKRIEQIENK